MWDNFVKFIHNISDWLEALGFIAGIVTVIKVFLINRDVKKLQEKHLFQVRVDEHIEDLRKSSRKISSYLNSFQTNSRDFKLEVSKCIEHCSSIQKKVSVNDLSNLTPLIRMMKKLRNGRFEQNLSSSWFRNMLTKNAVTQIEVDDAYTRLNSLITEIEHFNNDLKRTIK